ncbi:MAG: hypothetical protein H8D70_00585 [Rhodospirillaceae bacterium]|nr:hypothetical protein [Rhodospirillaceae bacterium]
MKRIPLTAAVLAMLIAAPVSSLAETKVSPRPTIISLQSEGWVIVKKTAEQKTLPGVAPYQDLKRVVQIVRYRLKKGDATMMCETAYDSQLDHFEESCRKGTR